MLPIIVGSQLGEWGQTMKSCLKDLCVSAACNVALNYENVQRNIPNKILLGSTNPEKSPELTFND